MYIESCNIFIVLNSCFVFSVCVVLKFFDFYIVVVYDKKKIWVGKLVEFKLVSNVNGFCLDFDFIIKYFLEYLLFEKCCNYIVFFWKGK